MPKKQIKPVSVALVGSAGMGQTYLETMLAGFPQGEIVISGVVEPHPERNIFRDELKDRSIPVYSSLEAVFENQRAPDLVVICSPIHLHVSQTCFAIEQGSCVLCEKPIGATIQDAEELIRVQKKGNPWVMIGYQWSFSRAIQSLKRDIRSGVFGNPLRTKALCFWPRDEAYYIRNDWAGKIKNSEGKWILDSPANNAMAHFLHNLFYLLGDEINGCAKPSGVTAELYRTYPIENYDTAACRSVTREGVEVLFYASHATSEDLGPMFSMEFENATISFGEREENIVVTDRSGSRRQYGSPEAEHPLRKLFLAVNNIRAPQDILCGPEASVAQTLCMNGMQESACAILDFPESKIKSDPDTRRRWVDDLVRELHDCYKKGAMPSEVRLGWAQPGRTVSLEDYHFFPREELA